MLRALAFAPVLGCTPLGLWLYKDPEVTVSRVRVGSDSLSAAPVLVALELLNPNDYPLSTVRVELSLALDDLPVGALKQDSTLDPSRRTRPRPWRCRWCWPRVFPWVG